MRPSGKFGAKAAGQKCSPEVVFSTLTPLDVVSFISNGVESIFSPTTQPSGFAANPEFTPDVSSLACLPAAIERVIRIGS